MAKTPKDRMQEPRLRAAGKLPPLKTCKACGKKLRATGVGRAYELSLCYKHYQESEEGKRYAAEKRKLGRQSESGVRAFRYFGCLPGGDAWPEGPFNRIRLAVSSTYEGKGKERGHLFIVWTDDSVTQHTGIRQSDVAGIKQEDGQLVDRSDLAELARTMTALTERVRHYGHGDTYLV